MSQILEPTESDQYSQDQNGNMFIPKAVCHEKAIMFACRHLAQTTLHQWQYHHYTLLISIFISPSGASITLISPVPNNPRSKLDAPNDGPLFKWCTMIVRDGNTILFASHDAKRIIFTPKAVYDGKTIIEFPSRDTDPCVFITSTQFKYATVWYFKIKPTTITDVLTRL